ncbi:hypothetical protein FJZ19_00545 [Candidatus Pacearchaeota archaeon]|nr:hypothetical protein [Candidatus Pacearchaeota archaeon]
MNKKGAIELSIGTIVIIVLALIMLILGIVFVRSIMCAGIQVSEDLGSGVKNQVRNLFGGDKLGVKCVGESGQEIKYGTGGRRQVVCIIKTDEQTEYQLRVKEVKSLSGVNTATAEKWIIDQDWKGKVSPGGNGAEATVLLLNIPKDAPTTSLKLTIEAKNTNTDSVTSHTLYIDIVPVGFFRTTLC